MTPIAIIRLTARGIVSVLATVAGCEGCCGSSSVTGRVDGGVGSGLVGGVAELLRGTVEG